jgi:serine/threonine-protein kinase SRPK3
MSRKNQSLRNNNYETNLHNSDEELNTDNYTEETMPIPEEIIYPGLVLKEDYVLLKKIGYGNNAGVWMTYQIKTKTYVALKIQHHECYHDGCREVAIIKKINNYCKQNQNKNIYCVTMLDYFVYEEDEETKFVCSVYDLYAGSIQMVLNAGKHKYGLPIPVVKKITKQVLIALATMHTELKIIHTDIKPENILFKGTPDDHLKIIELFVKSNFQKKYNDLYQTYQNDNQRFLEELEILALDSVREICTLEIIVNGGDEEIIPDDEDNDEDDFIEGDYDDYDNYDSDSEDNEEFNNENKCFNERKQSIDDIIEHLDYKEIHDIETEGDYDFETVLNNRPNTTDKKEMIDNKYIINCETALTDFGNSYFYEKRTKNEIQDRRYRAPEVILDFNYGYSCDIWSLACVVFELLTGFILFETHDHSLHKDIHQLFLMEKMLGPIPEQMKKATKRSKFLFDEERKYHIKNIEEFKPMPLKERLVKQFLFSEKDANEISKFLMCGLQYDPSKRFSAKDMLGHHWLNS